MKNLTSRILNELTERIEIYQERKIDGKRVQNLTVRYNCLKAVVIPDILLLTVHDVFVNTRKVVIANYAPDKIVV